MIILNQSRLVGFLIANLSTCLWLYCVFQDFASDVVGYQRFVG